MTKFYVLKEYSIGIGTIRLCVYPYKNKYQVYLLQDGKPVEKVGWIGYDSFTHAEDMYEYFVIAMNLGRGIKVDVPKSDEAEDEFLAKVRREVESGKRNWWTLKLTKEAQ